MKINKIGTGALYYNWVELFTLMLLVVGLMVSFLGDSALINYIMIILSGFVVGRYSYLKKKSKSFPFYFVSIGYLVGFVIGAIIRDRGNPYIITVLYIIAIYAGKYIYKHKYLKN